MNVFKRTALTMLILMLVLITLVKIRSVRINYNLANWKEKIVEAKLRLLDTKGYVTYEMFGAVGDGLTDDGNSIYNAHVYANNYNKPILCDSTKTYYIKERTEIPIKTNTNWNECNFIIDDRYGDDTKDTFVIYPTLEPISVSPKGISLNKKTKVINALAGNGVCFVDVEDSNTINFIRKGANAVDGGYPQTDQFIVDNNGKILSDIIWDFKQLTSIKLYKIDKTKLIVENGNFTTIENTKAIDRGYVKKGIACKRSNTVIRSCFHKTIENKNLGRPSYGFFRFENCSYVTFDNSIVTPRTTKYLSDGIPIGNYEFRFNKVVKYVISNIQGNSTSTNKWGVHTSNYTKDCYVHDCNVNRIDAHKGIYNLTIKDTTLGYQGLKLVGGGKLLVENVETHGSSLIELRGDYGSFWNGTMEFKNITHIPSDLEEIELIRIRNDGTWDFRYDCRLASKITITNYYLDDTQKSNKKSKLDLFILNTGNLNDTYIYKYNMNSEIKLENIKIKSGREYSMLDKSTKSVSKLSQGLATIPHSHQANK